MKLFRATRVPALPEFSANGRSRSLTLMRNPRSRRMRLSVDPRDGMVRLSCPRRTATAAAIAFAEQHRGWIEAQLAALPEAQPIAPGTRILFDGGSLTIDWREEASRIVRREGDRLLIGGPVEGIARRTLAWLKREALRRLEAETRLIAERAGVTIGKVAIGDPRTRWGSCSASGDIRYSWRLILAPRAVLEATVAHEVAHRLHMDHSPAFHAAAARLLGRDPIAEREWLRRHGSGLYWLGRTG